MRKAGFFSQDADNLRNYQLIQKGEQTLSTLDVHDRVQLLRSIFFLQCLLHIMKKSAVYDSGLPILIAYSALVRYAKHARKNPSADHQNHGDFAQSLLKVTDVSLQGLAGVMLTYWDSPDKGHHGTFWEITDAFINAVHKMTTPSLFLSLIQLPIERRIALLNQDQQAKFYAKNLTANEIADIAHPVLSFYFALFRFVDMGPRYNIRGSLLLLEAKVQQLVNNPQLTATDIAVALCEYCPNNSEQSRRASRNYLTHNLFTPLKKFIVSWVQELLDLDPVERNAQLQNQAFAKKVACCIERDQNQNLAHPVLNAYFLLYQYVREENSTFSHQHHIDFVRELLSKPDFTLEKIRHAIAEYDTSHHIRRKGALAKIIKTFPEAQALCELNQSTDDGLELSAMDIEPPTPQ